MAAYVFTDPALAPVAAQFVWLSVNTEKDLNQNFLEKFPIDVYPSLLVIDPDSEKAIRKWLGSQTVPELVQRLSEAAASLHQGSPADRALAQAGQRNAAGDLAGATKAFREALSVAPANWPSRPQAIEGLAFALQMQQRDDECVALAQKELPSMQKGTALVNVVEAGLTCALDRPKGDPVRAAAEPLAQKADALARDFSMPLLADDRSGLFGTLVDAREQLGDEAGSKREAADWAHFLEGEAAKAKTPEGRAVFDPHRLDAYLALGELEKAAAMLEQSERDLPKDYNPPARLAYVYLKMGRLDDALAQVQRAEKLVYGPRTLRILITDAQIQAARGRKELVKDALDRAERFVAALPKPQQSPYMMKTIAGARKQLLEGK